MTDDRPTGYRGVCLLCGHRTAGAGSDDLEESFFEHFARTHESAEPVYSLTDAPGGESDQS